MITGATRIFGIVADPIDHVQAPQALNRILSERGVDGVMVPFHVRGADLAAFAAGVRAMGNMGGLVVTVPHKTAMLALCDDVSPRAKRIGAVNVVRREGDGRLTADMLDGEGFVAGLRGAGVEPRGLDVYLAGAGGAARAIAFALAEAGAAGLTLANRTREKSEQLARDLRAHYPAIEARVGDDPAGHALVVNATSLGLRPGDALPLDVKRVDSGGVVAEIVMKPEHTPLMEAARARGLSVHPGKPMLASQLNLMASFLGMMA